MEVRSLRRCRCRCQGTDSGWQIVISLKKPENILLTKLLDAKSAPLHLSFTLMKKLLSPRMFFLHNGRATKVPRCVGLIFFASALLTLVTRANPRTPGTKLNEPSGFSFASPVGVQEGWVSRYDGPDNYDDEATAIAVDGSGNVYVTGFSFDATTDYDYATIKYNSAGQRQWLARYDGTGSYIDQATAIAVDGSGNVYVTGASTSGTGGLDYATIKYNSAGQQQWVAYYDGPGDLDDVPTSIAVDGSSNVYVTGGSYGSESSLDYATIKYNSAGQAQWVARYNGPVSSDDEAAAIVVDGSGNVYVTGSSYGSGFSQDYATIKYNTVGQEQWVVRYDGPASGDDEATAMAIDGSGNVYVAGYSYGSVGYDYATIKYNSTGQQQWVRRYDGPAHSDDTANAIVVDGSANVYVTGSSYGSESSQDYATIKYDSAGQQQWVRRYDGPGNSDDIANGIAVDGSGNVYVTGSSYGSGFNQDYATIVYTPTGQQQWVARYDGPGNYDDIANGIAVDNSGNVYVTGSSLGFDTDRDYATIKYVQGATPTPTPPTRRPTPRPRPTPVSRPTPPR
jgi:uncharacterized delta-60 repeat protein